jgi:hypothetical protein
MKHQRRILEAPAAKSVLDTYTKMANLSSKVAETKAYLQTEHALQGLI